MLVAIVFYVCCSDHHGNWEYASNNRSLCLHENVWESITLVNTPICSEWRSSLLNCKTDTRINRDYDLGVSEQLVTSSLLQIRIAINNRRYTSNAISIYDNQNHLVFFNCCFMYMWQIPNVIT